MGGHAACCLVFSRVVVSLNPKLKARGCILLIGGTIRGSGDV